MGGLRVFRSQPAERRSSWNLTIGSSLLNRPRICEITLYLVPRAIETLIGMLNRRYPSSRVPHYDALIFALTIACIHYYY